MVSYAQIRTEAVVKVFEPTRKTTDRQLGSRTDAMVIPLHKQIHENASLRASNASHDRCKEKSCNQRNYARITTMVCSLFESMVCSGTSSLLWRQSGFVSCANVLCVGSRVCSGRVKHFGSNGTLCFLNVTLNRLNTRSPIVKICTSTGGGGG